MSNRYHYLIKQAKKIYYTKSLESSASNPGMLWKTVNKLLHRKSDLKLPSNASSSSVADLFSSFFADKIIKLRSPLYGKIDRTASPHFPSPPSKPPLLSHLEPATEDEVLKLLSSSPNKQCDLDPIPTQLLKQCSTILLPTITKIINLSLSAGVFPSAFKEAIVKPLLKKPSLDKESLANYRLISNLSFMSKLTEKIVKARLSKHLSDNSLWNNHQSAYLKHNSTEFVLLSLYNHLIAAIDNQYVSCLCLLDLSAAFDTIDHSILLERLNIWFGISQNALSWFKSYLSSRSFVVHSLNLSSNPTPIDIGVPQGSVLGPLLFILYTTPLSSLINSSCVSHHLYADDTQLFISFPPISFQASLTSLQSILSAIASWTSANFLALNPSKTEFLLLGLPKQLAKIENATLLFDNATIEPASFACNLGFIFGKHLSFEH
jgi:hypothetical protein